MTDYVPADYSKEKGAHLVTPLAQDHPMRDLGYRFEVALPNGTAYRIRLVDALARAREAMDPEGAHRGRGRWHGDDEQSPGEDGPT